MLDNVRVKDLYIKIDDYPNVSLDAPIGHAIHIMNHVLEDENKYRNILVLDDDDHLQGYLSLRDLIRAVGPEYLQKRHPDIKGNQPFYSEEITEDYVKSAQKKVQEFETKRLESWKRRKGRL